MSRKRKPLPLLEKVEITQLAAEGKSLARVDDLVVFVPYVVPGDVVDLQLTKKKHNYAEAEAVRFHQFSPHRVEPVCQHFGVCGGCKWQCLDYEQQLYWKQRQVMDALQRIGKVELPECQPIMGSKQTLEYRNKMEFGCANKRWLTREQIQSGETFEHNDSIGFHAGGAFDKILPIEKCHLMPEVNNSIRLCIRDYAWANGLTFYDAREHVGLLRGVMIRLSNTGELMILLQFCINSDEEQHLADGLMAHLHACHPEISSLLWVNNTKCNDTFGDLPVHNFYGTDAIFLEMEDLRFKVGPKSFYQTNTNQAYELYKVARDFAQLTGNELVYDLYTGTGTIANFLARRARQVVGIEYVPDAIEDAKINSRINGIENTLFYAGDMKDVLNKEFIARHGRPDVIVTDPPRAGMHQDVVDVILFAHPKRIVYVSCNPATQARDLQLLDAEYKVTRIQPVDMFPHTQHVENVVLLELRSGD
ncbi:MAG: 23S rRNA (uracil(1939)-C(5))-methyltransferase RlmD [Bacteroidaceae bacterium]|nr:23S rRNA (uracil(1939)-C(5))-methyltransferase RlmD [Bacteroidaceae bacterium]